MDGFLQQLRRHWAERFGSGPRHLVVAVSGGLDSMVLLHSLARLRRKFPWQLTVAHCHHGLRGAQADGDADWVRAQSAALGLPCVVEEVAVRTAAAASRESLEMAARRLRHAFLARSALSVGSMEVVLAHHAQDQAELVLLRLLRGSGSDGLAGMKERSPSPADRRVSLLRPFLGFDRGTLEAFARNHGIGHREDASNQDLSIPRNRIRHQLIPDWMAHYSPALPRVLARIADIAAHESDYLREQAQRWRDSLHPEPWASLHVALQRAILRIELLEQGPNADFDVVERLRRARCGSVVDKHSVDPAVAPRAQANPCHPTGPSETVSVAFRGMRGQRVLPEGSLFRWKRLKRPLPFGDGWEQLDATTVPETASLRHRRPGDRFQRLGQSNAARLQNLFINQRVAVAERAQRWVLDLGDGSLAWVEGFSAGERHRLTPSTTEILAIQIQKP
ncbi:MAG: tRNA lysidine(34) synthetase TilS [Verrucomicrobia bacterium]|nr:tRNA lysidine(34) synthetase TilS [Verrucomicrobiota bacterium]